MKWFFAIAAGLMIAGCSSQSPKSATGSSTETDSTGADTFKVALLTPGSVTDGGWNTMAYDGLKSIEVEMKASIKNQEATGPKIKDAMRSYAQEGYSLVFGHGFEYNEPASVVAADFPNTYFVTSGGGKTAPNLAALRFHLEQGFYIAGYMSGLSSRTGKVAMIGGDDVPSIRSTFKAFRAGALAAKPGIVVIEVFTRSGQDIAAAKLATLKAIDEGADFVIHQANNAAPGVFAACAERKVWAIGSNLDQNRDRSGVVIGSAVIQARGAFLRLAQQVAAKNFEGKVTLMGMTDDAIDFILNPELSSKLPEGVVEKVIKVRDDVKSGVTQVPTDEF